MDSYTGYIEKIGEILTVWGIKVIAAIAILVFGYLTAKVLKNITRKSLNKAKIDPSIISFVNHLVFTLVLVFTILAVLSKFGIQTTSIIAVLGAGSLAIGLALQGSLSDFAAGVMILLFRPFRIGNYIDSGGTAGTVSDIQLFATILNTPDNIRIIVPNSKIMGSIIKNYSAEDTRRVDLVFGVGYSASIADTLAIIRNLLQQDARVLSDPAPQIVVTDLAESSVNIAVRPWVKSADYWDVKFDLTRQFKEACEAHGIEIPFPQRTIHMISS
ncbi:mechanosensitive ion channel [bacterium]|nr:mechanosensitive ion channel [candidate division CSSED10-310 bacterium]